MKLIFLVGEGTRKEEKNHGRKDERWIRNIGDKMGRDKKKKGI
jgi:hypothetical protein